MKINVASSLVCASSNDCPMSMDQKSGLRISWTDDSKVRCSFCIFCKGFILDEDKRVSYIDCSYGDTVFNNKIVI